MQVVGYPRSGAVTQVLQWKYFKTAAYRFLTASKLALSLHLKICTSSELYNLHILADSLGPVALRAVFLSPSHFFTLSPSTTTAVVRIDTPCALLLHCYSSQGQSNAFFSRLFVHCCCYCWPDAVCRAGGFCCWTGCCDPAALPPLQLPKYPPAAPPICCPWFKLPP